jgi:hypothetical protein
VKHIRYIDLIRQYEYKESKTTNSGIFCFVLSTDVLVKSMVHPPVIHPVGFYGNAILIAGSLEVVGKWKNAWTALP